MAKPDARRGLLATTALTVAVFAFMGEGAAAPEGGSVTAGSATITSNGPLTSVTQFSSRAILNWASFNVASGETVQFIQPGASSFILNRINDAQASRIDGAITANGRVMLLNQNGIVFGSTSRVDVAGLIATTSQVDDASFMSGATKLSLTPGANPQASIVNNGAITAADAGLVGLVAPTVENNGVIQAHLGKVTLAGAERVTLDLAGDGLISIDVTDQANGLVKNSGSVIADGGTITLTASRAKDAVAASIVNTGTLRANTVQAKGGRILLLAGGHRSEEETYNQSSVAAVQNKGVLEAKGVEPGDVGGTIEVYGDSVSLSADSLIDASGVSGGGTVNVGGEYQGGGTSPTATWVEAEEGSVTQANGGYSGDGGDITFWADRLMYFRGRIEAEGGEEEGNGGTVEVSGKNRLIYDGVVSTIAKNGVVGTLLLDPTDIQISAGPSQNVTLVSPFSPDADDVVSVLDAATLLTALSTSSVIVQTRATGSQPGDITVSVALTWGSGNTLTLQADHNIVINQAITGGSLTLSAGNDITINAALTGTGTLTIESTLAATTMGIGTGQTGTIGLTNAEIANITNGWASLVFGRTDGTGAVNVGALTWNDNVTLQSGSGVITIGGIQTMGANNLTFTTDADIALNAALTGTGTLTISQSSVGTTLGLGNAAAGTVNLTATEVGRITNGWASLIFGRTDGTGAVNVTANTWNDVLTLRSGSGVITIGGIQTMGANNLTFTTDADLAINAALTGTGTLTVGSTLAATSYGLGTGQAGTIQWTNAEIANITNGWASLVFGNTAGTGAVNVGALTWNDALTLRSLSGAMNINGTQTMGANNLTITTDSNLALAVGANLTSTGNLTIGSQSAATTIGVGTGQAGALSLTDTELNQITDGWASIVIGSISQTGAMNVGARTWNDTLSLRTGSGAMNINGTQTMGANSLTLSTNANLALAVGANLTGTGTLTITPSAAATTIGVGTGQAGALSLTDTELSQITDGWTSIILGATTGTGAINIGALTWNDVLTLRSLSGTININGAQTMGANNLTISTDSNLNIGAALTGTGTLTISSMSAATTMALGTGQTGTIQIDATEIGRITDGWTSLVFGNTAGTGAINIGALTWNDALTITSNTGVVTVNGAQVMGVNNLTFTTNADLAINATLAGTGTLTVQALAAATTIGIAGGAGTINLSVADLGYMLNDWTGVVFGSASGTGAMAIGAYTWQYNTTFRTGAGIITVSGAQVSTGPGLTYETDGNMAVAANISGTGTLTIRPSANATAMNIATGAAGLNLTVAELAFIQDGWSQIVFGKSTETGAVTVGAKTWTDNVQFISGSGVLTVAAQTMGANNLTLTTDSNLAVTGNLSGSGALTIEGTSSATAIGVGTGQAGVLNLTAAEIGFIVNGWSNVKMGSAASTAAINIGTNTWSNDMTFITNGNVILNGVQTSTKNSGNSLVFASLAGAFINNAGATPINPGTGTARYLIYSVSAGTDTYGAMTVPGATAGQTYFSYGPSSVVEVGNRIIYSSGAAKIIYLQIDSKTKVYGDAVPVLTWTYIGGLQGGDTLGAAITSSTLTAAGSLTTDDVGTTRSITGIFGTGLGYSTSVVDGTLSVTKAPLVAQPVSTSRAYGDANPVFTVNYIGLKNGETAAVIDTLASASTAATLTSNVGSYAITAAGASDNNYAVNYAAGTLTITKANLTVTADDKSREYGLANPAFTLSYSGFKNGETSAVVDTAPTASTAALITSNVGSYAITLAGGTDNNYNLVLVNGALTITKATLTATADDKSREYGLANPALSVSYAGFRNGETTAVIDTLASASTAAGLGSNVGSYAITAAGGIDNNYDFAYVDGALTITKATLTATADDKFRYVGALDPVFTYSVSGLRAGDTAAVLSGVSAGTNATALSPAGVYTITLAGGVAVNYNISYAPGVFNIYNRPPAPAFGASDVPGTVHYVQSHPGGYGYFQVSDSVFDVGTSPSGTEGYGRVFYYEDLLDHKFERPLIYIAPELWTFSRDWVGPN